MAAAVCRFSSCQQFGWMEGIQLDALRMLIQTNQYPPAIEALDARRRMWSDAIRASPESMSRSLYTIEATLPFIAWAKHNLADPLLDRVIEFWRTRQDERGLVKDGPSVSSEGCYTLAYPMMMLAVERRSSELHEMALAQLRHRVRRLSRDGAIHQKAWLNNGRLRFANWGRGIAWYVLGLDKTLAAMESADRPDDLLDALQQAFGLAWPHQRDDGLFGCFIDDPRAAADTSGTAGIAAAVACAAYHNLLPFDQRYRDGVYRANEALASHVGSDGFVRGASQLNKGGRPLQTAKFRVISQYVTGLAAMCTAYLNVLGPGTTLE